MARAKEIILDSFRRHIDVFGRSSEMLAEDFERLAGLTLEAIKNNRCIFACGNGGSAADSQHLVAEFVCRYKDDRRPLKAVALTVNTSVLTAIGNDYGFEHVFSRQLMALGSSRDVLIIFTTSGPARDSHSKNILNALNQAKSQGLKTVVFTGGRGVVFKSMADVVMVVPSEEAARIQEVHQLIYHSLCEYIDAELSLNKPA